MSSVFSKWMQWSCCRVGRSAKAEKLSILPQSALRRWSHTSDHQKYSSTFLSFLFSPMMDSKAAGHWAWICHIKLDLFRESMPAPNSPELEIVIKSKNKGFHLLVGFKNEQLLPPQMSVAYTWVCTRINPVFASISCTVTCLDSSHIFMSVINMICKVTTMNLENVCV